MMTTSIFVMEVPDQSPSLWGKQSEFLRKDPPPMFLEGSAAAARPFCDCESDREGFCELPCREIRRTQHPNR